MTRFLKYAVFNCCPRTMHGICMRHMFVPCQVRFLKSSRDFKPPWEKPVTLLPDTLEAISWCAARSSSSAKEEREATMERVRRLSARLHESGSYLFMPC